MLNICKKTCNDCPFRKQSLPGWLGDYNSAQELHNIVMSEAPFPCHLTHTDEEISFEEAGTVEHPLCAGALMYMRKAGKLPRNKELLDAMKSFPISELDAILSYREFFQHHSK